jgi:hypothetical protein
MMGGTMRWTELRMCSFWAGGISSFPFSRAREYRLLRRLGPAWSCLIRLGLSCLVTWPAVSWWFLFPIFNNVRRQIVAGRGNLVYFSFILIRLKCIVFEWCCFKRKYLSNYSSYGNRNCIVRKRRTSTFRRYQFQFHHKFGWRNNCRNLHKLWYKKMSQLCINVFTGSNFKYVKKLYECSRKRQFWYTSTRSFMHACSVNGSIFTEFLNELGSRLNLHFVLTWNKYPFVPFSKVLFHCCSILSILITTFPIFFTLQG